MVNEYLNISFLAECPDEANNIAIWYYDEWAQHAPDVTLDMVLKNVREKAANSSEFPMALVCHIGEVLVGALELKIRENKHYLDYEHWVGGVYTHPDYRGKGIASALLTRAKQQASAVGVHRLYLQCDHQLVSFYTQHGFTKLHVAANDLSISIMQCKQIP